MPLHDAYARTTPFELAFRDRDRANRLADAIEEESAGRGADADDPHAFVTMAAVAAFVGEVEGPDAPPGAIHRYGALAFHGVRFARAGCPLFVLSAPVARYLVEGTPEGDASPPARAGYLQFPQHLFWTDGGAGVPESVDGAFWSVTANGFIHTLLATGLRPDRPGLGVVPLPEAPLTDAPLWLHVDARGDGSDYEADMPGGEIDGLYSLSAAGEVLKLLARFFAYTHSVPRGLLPVGPPVEGDGNAIGPARSVLPFTRVVLDAS